eukprot:m.176761 g.176761  ORF g.176761 m.176761 type:complete len:800 (+) comp21389_c0_seq3:11-2410(+)
MSCVLRTLPLLALCLLASRASLVQEIPGVMPTLQLSDDCLSQGAADASTHVFGLRPANPDSDAYRRFLRAAEQLQLPVTAISNADFSAASLRTALATVQDPKNTVVFLLADTQNALFTDKTDAVKDILKMLNARILFPTDSECHIGCNRRSAWSALSQDTMRVRVPDMLMPGAVMGYADSIMTMLEEITDGSLLQSEQLAALVLDPMSRARLHIALDYRFDVFLGLREAGAELDESTVKMDMSANGTEFNTISSITTSTTPVVVLAQENTPLLHQIGNYVPSIETVPNYDEMPDEARAEMESARIHISLTVGPYSPFLQLTLNSVAQLTYPKQKLSVSVAMLNSGNSTVLARNQAMVEAWIAEHTAEYQSMSLRLTADDSTNYIQELVEVQELGADYVFMMDSLVRLTNANVLQHLVASKKSMVAPLLTRPEKLWSTFWGAVDDDMDFAACVDESPMCERWALQDQCDSVSRTCRKSCKTCLPFTQAQLKDYMYKGAFDYRNLVEHKAVGAWAVPYVFGGVFYSTKAAAMLTKEIQTRALPLDNLPAWELCVVLSRLFVEQGMLPTMINQVYYGHYVNPEGYDELRVHPDMYMLPNNPEDWSALYLHPEYSTYADVGFVPNCNDVFRIPLLSPQFCQELIEECEAFGEWSGGAYSDPRLSGGFEPVPTRDIHFNQIGMQDTWFNILTRYVRPVAAHHYVGYWLEGKETLDFVVKYHPDGQRSLRPHHDASTLTVNVALNQGGVDYEGGGTHFTRQNCTLRDNPPGWGSLSPGRLTHQHEGLETTKGTRYILVSFIDQRG